MADPLQMRVDGAELRALSRDLRRLDKSLLNALRRGLRAAAKPVLAAARANAAQVSPAVAGTIRVRTSFTAKRSGVFIEAAGKAMPEGHQALPGLLERGSAGLRGGATFEHPVFGRLPPVTQKTHPYLAPALAAHADAAEIEIRKAIDEAAKAAGL